MMNNTSFYKDEYIVSFDTNKTWIERNDGSIVFCKKTCKKELNNYKKMTKLILNKRVKINNKKYIIKTPGIIKWDSFNEILYLEYCNGENLEFLLRNKKTHKKGVTIINCLLNFFIENRIYWADFAPRNIILNKDNIYIVDFEKGIRNKINLRNYLRINVLEEYCLFLLKNERLYNINDILLQKNERNIKYKINNIKDKRYLNIAKQLGFKDIIDKKEYLFLLHMILKIEEPQLINGKFYFPGVEFDKIFVKNEKEKALKIYSKKIVGLIKEYNGKTIS